VNSEREEGNHAPNDVSSKASSGWLLLILGIALVLRCAFLSKESLWLDEVQSWWFASDFGRALAAEPTNPPLYYTTLHFWMSWFGTSEAALRSLSILPGVLSVGLVYALAKKLFARGLYAVLLLVSLYNYFFSPRFGREQRREAVAYIESVESGKIVIVFDPSWLRHCYEYYQKRGLPHVSVTESSDLGQLAGYDSIWLIRSHSESTTAQDMLAIQLRRDSYRAYPNGDGIEVSLFHPQHP
jgi:predicted membrane-bound mannosyltransferase